MHPKDSNLPDPNPKHWFITLLVFGVLSGLSHLTIAQNTIANYSKYLCYRDRLLKEFMVPSDGNELGTNIPASIANTDNQQMRWGDATINLSNYIAVLATEYKLLKLNGLSNKHTVSELNRAMLALERLDATAEAFYGAPQAVTKVNGFFIRDDVPASFTKDWAWLNPAFEKFPNVKSDYSAIDKRDNEMSQDQVWHLVIGLALVSHLVDDTTTFFLPDYYGNKRLTFEERASILAALFIRIMQQKSCLIHTDAGNELFCYRYWRLKNPVTGQDVKRGANPSFLKYGFAETGNFITGEMYGNLHWGRSNRTQWAIDAVKTAQKFQSLTRRGDRFHLYHAAVLATIGDIWTPNQLIRNFNRHRRSVFTPYPQYEHFALLSVVLHNNYTKLVMREQPYYEKLLNVAPLYGPRNYGNDPNRPYVYEWSSVSRFVWPERLGGNAKYYFYGDYNGLDYMLLFNLYHLVYDPLFISNITSIKAPESNGEGVR